MPNIFTEGFDAYPSTNGTAGASSSGWSVISGSAYSLIAGRFGGQALRTASRTGASYNWSATKTFSSIDGSIDGVGLTGSFGLALRSTVAYRAFALGQNGSICLMFLVDSAGVYRIYRGDGTALLLSTPAQTWRVSAWHYVEIEFTINDTTGSLAIYIDGELKASATGLDTRAGTETTINTVRIIDQGDGATHDFDDMYLSNSATRIGEGRIDFLRPTADTVEKDFARSVGTENFALVDETLADGDTTYVQGSVVGDLDRYELANLPTTPNAIFTVNPMICAMKTDAASRSIAMSMDSGGTINDSSNFALSATYGWKQHIRDLDPNTGAVWSAAAVTALKLGPKVTV